MLKFMRSIIDLNLNLKNSFKFSKTTEVASPNLAQNRTSVCICKREPMEQCKLLARNSQSLTHSLNALLLCK